MFAYQYHEGMWQVGRACLAFLVASRRIKSRGACTLVFLSQTPPANLHLPTPAPSPPHPLTHPHPRLQDSNYLRDYQTPLPVCSASGATVSLDLLLDAVAGGWNVGSLSLEMAWTQGPNDVIQTKTFGAHWLLVAGLLPNNAPGLAMHLRCMHGGATACVPASPQVCRPASAPVHARRQVLQRAVAAGAARAR